MATIDEHGLTLIGLSVGNLASVDGDPVEPEPEIAAAVRSQGSARLSTTPSIRCDDASATPRSHRASLIGRTMQFETPKLPDSGWSPTSPWNTRTVRSDHSSPHRLGRADRRLRSSPSRLLEPTRLEPLVVAALYASVDEREHVVHHVVDLDDGGCHGTAARHDCPHAADGAADHGRSHHDHAGAGRLRSAARHPGRRGRVVEQADRRRCRRRDRHRPPTRSTTRRRPANGTSDRLAGGGGVDIWLPDDPAPGSVQSARRNVCRFQCRARPRGATAGDLRHGRCRSPRRRSSR